MDTRRTGGWYELPVSTQTEPEPVDPDEGRPAGPGNPWFALWDGYFAVCYVVTTVLLFAADAEQARRAMAVGALTLVVPWYAAVGRALMTGGEARCGHTPRNVVFVTGLLLLFTTASAFDPTASFALFAVVPMLLMTLPVPTAMVLLPLVNLLPTVTVWLNGGDVAVVFPMSLLGITLSVFLGLWVNRVVRQSQERAALIEELHRSRERLAELSREAGVAAERERLAREIHDTVAQGLTSIISLLQAADAQLAQAPDQARSYLELAGRVAGDSLAEAREFVTVLTPAPLKESSLPQAVRRQADDLAAQTGLAAECAIEGDERPLPMPVNVVLLRAVQETVANVRKHAAGATRVDIVLRYGPDAVRLTVRDDGAGFDAERQREGHGLPGMRSRVREIGGEAAVDSRPGYGTTVAITVPLDVPDGEGTDGS